jgi:hypothetical protein
MRLVVIVLLAGLLSLFAGLAVTIAGSAVIPCSSDPAGCGMGEAYRVFGVPVYALIAMATFGLSAAGKNREGAVRIAMKVLLLVPLFLIAFSIVADLSAGKPLRSSDMLEALQAAAPVWAVILTQWFVVRDFLRRRAQEPPSAPAGTGDVVKRKVAVPWISLAVMVIAAISPPGREILGNTLSGEALSSSIALFAAAVSLGGLLALIEYAIRTALIRRVRAGRLSPRERVSS